MANIPPGKDLANPTELTVVWHALTAEDVVEQLKTQPQTGLTSQEAAERLVKHGPNKLVEAGRSTFLQMLAGQLKDFLVILLIIASVVSFLLGDWIEAAAIMLIVILNAALGVIQESRAEEALAALKKLAAPESQVLRDGKRISIPAQHLVPGDIVIHDAGNHIPADVRLLEAVNLRIEEAALTGESVPVQKNASARLETDIPLGDRKNTAFMGTMVTYGRGRGVVVNTGMRTQLGMIATMLQSVSVEETPLQRRLEDLGKILGWAALAICALVFIIGIIRTHGSLQEIINLFMIAVSLAIAAVPEGLPAIVTISLALGMREMIRRHALIRRLSSVETLGSATVICTDKTGTLTQNEMTATRLWVDGRLFEITGSGYNPTGDFKLYDKKVDLQQYPGATTALWVGILNNDAQLEQSGQSDEETTYRMVGDPTEGAILVAAAKSGLVADPVTRAYPREGEIPFDADRKRMVTLHALKNHKANDISPFNQENPDFNYAIAVKGAPDIVLNLCTAYQTVDDYTHPLTHAKREEILAANDSLTQDALRVLGLAYRPLYKVPTDEKKTEMEKDLIFVGLMGMIDPPRPEVRPALEEARDAGIRTIMITGDYPNTARAIAQEIDLLQNGHKVLTGAEINQMDDGNLRREVLTTDVYARVSPEHKMRIVDALRSNGQVVAMTGDGVNDAPAIKLADIGVAMGITGTDVAKETADMVLTDDNYASIVSAVEQGRIIYSNIRKFVYYLLSCNVAEIATIFIATLLGWPTPLTALQLLWLNLVTDGAPALALGTEKGDPDIMHQKPRPPKEPIINRYMKIGIVAQTLAITGVTLSAYYLGRFIFPEHIEYARTMSFVTLSCSELLRAFTARSEYYPLYKIGFFSNRWMNLAVLSSLVLILAVVYAPIFNVIFNTEQMGWDQWQLVLPLIFVPSLTAEATKLIFAPRMS